MKQHLTYASKRILWTEHYTPKHVPQLDPFGRCLNCWLRKGSRLRLGRSHWVSRWEKYREVDECESLPDSPWCMEELPTWNHSKDWQTHGGLMGKKGMAFNMAFKTSHGLILDIEVTPVMKETFIYAASKGQLPWWMFIMNINNEW